MSGTLSTRDLSSAAVERAGVERGDPLALAKLLTVQELVSPSGGERPAYLSPISTAADEPVTVNLTGRAAAKSRVGELPAGQDGAAMEHERQRRLVRWQVER